MSAELYRNDEVDIKIATNDMISSFFDGNIYGNEITEAYVEPCVFTSVRLNDEFASDAISSRMRYRIYITYFQREEEYSEKKAYDFLHCLRIALIKNDPARRHYVLKFGSSFAEAKNLEINWIGSESKIPEYSFMIEFNSNTALVDDDLNYDYMNDIEYDQKEEE